MNCCRVAVVVVCVVAVALRTAIRAGQARWAFRFRWREWRRMGAKLGTGWSCFQENNDGAAISCGRHETNRSQAGPNSEILKVSRDELSTSNLVCLRKTRPGAKSGSRPVRQLNFSAWLSAAPRVGSSLDLCKSVSRSTETLALAGGVVEPRREPRCLPDVRCRAQRPPANSTARSLDYIGSLRLADLASWPSD